MNIEQLIARNNFLTNEIATLNGQKQSEEIQKRIQGNFEEIEKNNEIIKMLKSNN